jgi:alkylhydroperoxidase/carboxymuconolactone decarboxylase family protein YurZ
MTSTAPPTGPFTCEVTLRRIRAPQFIREEKQGVTYMIARGYEIAYETILHFTNGARLPVTARLVGELTQRVVIRDAQGRARRDRRLVTLTIAAVTGQRDPLRNHLRASLESGDLTLAEIHEWIIHLAHYGGWPAGTTASAVLGEISRAETGTSAAGQRGPNDART